MGRAFLGQSRIETRLLQGLAGGGARQRLVRSGSGEQPQQRLFLPPISAQDFEQFNRQQRDPLLAPFGVTHMHQHPLGIDIRHTQVAGFVNAQTGAITGHEQRALFQAAKHVKQSS